MGALLSKQGPGYAQDSELSDELRSTLKDLESLYIRSRFLKPKKGSELGQGGFGDVFLAELKEPNRKPTDVAVKQLRPVGTKGDRTRLATRIARELRVWAKLNHPNVLGLVGFYLSDNYKIAQLVSVYMAQGNIAEFIKRSEPGDRRRLKFVKDITSGMKYLHEHDPPICHGDLKPANVLINDAIDAVLCDFGLASFIDGSENPSGLTTTRALKGSIRYLSPELLQDTGAKRSLPSDVWSWACTTYEIITDVKPYSEFNGDTATIAAMLRRVVPGTTEQMLRRIPADSMWPKEVFYMIADCWSFAADKRPTMLTLSDACEAPPSASIDLSDDTTFVNDRSSRFAKQSSTQLLDASTFSPTRPSLSGSALPTLQHTLAPQNSGQPSLSPDPSPFAPDQPLLTPGIYHVTCLISEEKDVGLDLCHGGIDQPISMSEGMEDPPAKEWVFTPKSGSSSQYSISNILSGQYLGFVGSRVEAMTRICWWTIQSNGTGPHILLCGLKSDINWATFQGFTLSANSISVVARTQNGGVDLTLERVAPDGQQWSITPVAHTTYGPYWIKHKETQNYLALQGGSYSDKTPALGTPDRKADLAFQWRIIPTGHEGSNLVRIQNVASGTCLIRHGEPVDNAVQISGWANPYHTWVSNPAPGEPDARIFQVSGTVYVAELYAGSSMDGTNAVIWPFKENHARQIWYLEPTSS